MFGSIHRDSKSVSKVKGECNLVKHVNGKAVEGNVSLSEWKLAVVARDCLPLH